MYYIVDIGLKQPYVKEFSDIGSKEFQKVREMCQSFLLRIYHDHPYYHETIVKSIRNSKDYSIVTMLIRFTKQNEGNIKPFYKAIICKCGCEYFFNDLFFKLAPANGTDLGDFCPASCLQQGSSQCEATKDCHGCCHGLPTGNYFLQKIPSPFMQEMLCIVFLTNK
ncbi:hypothetical protein MXB_3731 [Myxobolus squamalis]|nr:hypothetical protein MXB_3731 [Myxobolus squamalis]